MKSKQVLEMSRIVEPMKLTKFEKKLVKNKFKIKFLDDGSGYWFKKKFDFPIFNKIKCNVEPSRNLIFFEVSSDEDYVEIKYVVENWKQCKKLLKKFDLI